MGGVEADYRQQNIAEHHRLLELAFHVVTTAATHMTTANPGEKGRRAWRAFLFSEENANVHSLAG